MSIQDVELTARLVGVPLPELWTRYVAVGGTGTLADLTDRLGGDAGWPPAEELFLAAALHDAMIDESLTGFAPLADLLTGPPPTLGAGWAGRPGGRPLVFVPSGRAADMAVLIDRARTACSSARALCAAAQLVHDRVAAGAHRPGGRAAPARTAVTGPRPVDRA